VYYLNASALGLSTGVHTLMWGIRDNGGNATNIGSRYFTLAATGGQSTAQAAEAPLAQSGAASVAPVATLATLPARASTLSASVNGAAPATVVPDAGGVARVQMPALGLLSLDLGGPLQRGYETAADGPHALPVGSTLDASRGRFYWQPGIGFFGPFHLVFVSTDSTRTDVEVTIVDPTASGDVLLHIDTPQAMATEHGGFTIAGWTLDPHAVSGSGVAAVHVWAYRRDVPSVVPQFLGAAAIGGPRADVAQAYGAQFDHAAWSLDVSSLTPGVYDLVVYSWSERTRDWAAATVVPVVVR
jgi:hypothetical protein